MSSFMVLVLVLLVIATAVSLVSGIVSMGIGGKLDERNSERLMIARVVLQGAALLVVAAWLFFRH